MKEMKKIFNDFMENKAPKQLKSLFNKIDEYDGIMLQESFHLFAKYVVNIGATDKETIERLTKKSKDMENIQSGWQVCPKCVGQGKVWFPTDWPYNPTYTSGGEPYICDVCKGEKIINIETGLPPARLTTHDLQEIDRAEEERCKD